ncbi:MAG: glycosyltransferase, partial [Candidatus Margulisiibacteriota bacterium]
MARPKISVIVLNWNNYKDSKECLASLMNQNYTNLDIIFVDNGSTDKSADRLKKEFKNIKFICNTENFGYAKGNNIGIKHAIK